MEAPSLVTAKERQAIAEEIASKFLIFAAKVSVSFHLESIVIRIYPDEKLYLPPPGVHVVVVKRED